MQPRRLPRLSRHALRAPHTDRHRRNGEKQVLAFFINKYGPIVLAAPIRGGFDNAAWIVPIAVSILGGLGVFFLARRWRRPLDSQPNRHHTAPDPLTDYDAHLPICIVETALSLASPRNRHLDRISEVERPAFVPPRPPDQGPPSSPKFACSPKRGSAPANLSSRPERRSGETAFVPPPISHPNKKIFFP